MIVTNIDKKLKFKIIPLDRLLIFANNLCKFKNPSIKFKKFFFEIFDKYLIEPKIKIKNFDNYQFSYLKDLLELVFNESVKFYFGENLDYKNFDLFYKDNFLIYKLNSLELNYIDLKLDFLTLYKYCQQQCSCNFKRIIKSNIPSVNKIILVEGLTEELLLPKFSELCGYPFLDNGIKLIPCGGKTKVFDYYFDIISYVKIPVIVVFDSDAWELSVKLKSHIRDIDKMIILKSGEFEDLLLPSLIKKAINKEYQNYVNIEIKDIDKNLPKVKALEKLFKEKSLGEFSKSKFAKIILSVLSRKSQLSQYSKYIIDIIKSV